MHGTINIKLNKIQLPNFTKLRQVGAEVFHADGQTDRHTKLIVSFRNFAKAPKT